MVINHKVLPLMGILSALSLCVPGYALAAGQGDKATAQTVRQVEKRINELEQQLKALKDELSQTKEQVKAASEAAGQAKEAAAAPENATMKFRLSATAVANYTSSNKKLGESGAKNAFAGGAFLPVFVARYKDLAEFEAHMEFVNSPEEEGGAGTESSLEYAQADLFLNDRLTLVAGKFLSPVGQFQQTLHPAWINKLPDRPAGFVEDGGAEPISDVGVQLRGAWPLKETGSVNYAVFMGNGPRLTDEGLNLEGFTGDNNNNKALGGRVGIRPWGDLNIGASLMRADVPDETGNEATYSLTGADFSYTPKNLDVRGEYIHSALDPITFDGEAASKTKWDLWYVQAGYRIGKIEPVVRYGEFDVKGGPESFGEAAETRTTAGVAYWFGPTLVAKAAYEHRNLKNAEDDNRVRLQMAYEF